jgi:hypothetical protein
VVVVCTVIRIPNLVDRWSQSKTDAIIFNFLCLVFVDLPTIFPLVVVLASLYRIPIVAKKWTSCPYGLKNRGLIWAQAFKCLCDLMFAPFALVVIVTIYRAPQLFRKVCLAIYSRVFCIQNVVILHPF